MTIEAKVIADSVSPWMGDRLTTMQLRYPRIIHAECKTHRLLRIDDAEVEFLQEISLMDDPNLSRNASSSRAVPVAMLIEEARTNPAMPVRFGANRPGMQDKGGNHDGVLDVYTYNGFEWKALLDLRLRQVTGPAHPDAVIIAQKIQNAIQYQLTLDGMKINV